MEGLVGFGWGVLLTAVVGGALALWFISTVYRDAHIAGQRVGLEQARLRGRAPLSARQDWVDLLEEALQGILAHVGQTDTDDPHRLDEIALVCTDVLSKLKQARNRVYTYAAYERGREQ